MSSNTIEGRVCVSVSQSTWDHFWKNKDIEMSFLDHHEMWNSGVNFYSRIHREWDIAQCDCTNEYLDTKETERPVLLLFTIIGFGLHGILNLCWLLTLYLVALDHQPGVSGRRIGDKANSAFCAMGRSQHGFLSLRSVPHDAYDNLQELMLFIFASSLLI